MGWWRERSEITRDAVGAVPIVLIFVFAQQIYGEGGPAWRAVAIVCVMGVALSVRRRWPMATFVAALGMVLVATTGLEFLAIASYTLVAHRPRTHPAVVGVAAGVAMFAGHLRYWSELVLDEIAGDLILILGLSVVPVAIGQAVRSSRRTTAELEIRNAELVALREKEAQHAVEAERFHIARELHDVVAHHVSAMTVRARAGGHVASRDPQAAEDALSYIADAGTETLTAMGAFVGTLRGKESDTKSQELAPQPGLDDLPDLLESFRGTGLVIHADIDASPATIDSALGLNTYRIVQEALTNAIRHGAAERAWVRVWFAEEMLRIQVDDNGHGLRVDCGPAGHGLIGVAERAALHGGTSSLGVSDRGGCRMEAGLAAANGPPPAKLEGVDAPEIRS